VPWRLNDPTEPPGDPSEVADWKGLREWLATQGTKGRRPVQKVYPEPNGSRHGAYREMGEPLPGSAPQTAHDWRSLPPVPDVAAVPAMAAAFVPDGSDPPF
jgi:hypothetical protein